jgi:hypothetical protein
MRHTSVGKYHIRLTFQTEAIGSVMERHHPKMSHFQAAEKGRIKH